MLTALKSLLNHKAKPPPSWAGRLIYAVGDIHGRLDLFEKALALIYRDSRHYPESPLVVLLGDYVDRGPDSRGVLDRILSLQKEDWCELTVLMGNHEETLLKFLERPLTGSSWCDYGGAVTLSSYGVPLPRLRSQAGVWEHTRDEFINRLPQSHFQLMQSMKLFLPVDDYLFVHAGVAPGRPLAEQGAETFLWIRQPFLSARKSCDYVVVHGHTPRDVPENLRWRIGLDTGGYATGVLAGVRLYKETRGIFKVTI